MPRQLELLPALRDWGLEVVQVNGWQTRGSSSFNPKGSVNHHTAGARNGKMPSLGILVNGRSDLPGPLCNVGQSRSTQYDPSAKLDIVYLVAAGRANHAGPGGWQGLVGNSSVFGLEVEHVGSLSREPFDDRRLETSYRVHRAFMEVGGYGEASVAQHKEWAPRRKIDFIDAYGPHFRRGLAALQKTNSVFWEDDDVLAAACLAIEAAYEEAGYAPSKARGKAIAKWIDEARKKALSGGDPWEAVRTCRSQLAGVPIDPKW